MSDNVINLRAIDRKRVNAVYERMQAIPTGNDIWYIHTVLSIGNIHATVGCAPPDEISSA